MYLYVYNKSIFILIKVFICILYQLHRKKKVYRKKNFKKKHKFMY